MALAEYARKRDFTKTAEPEALHGRGKSGNRFVIQKHAASRLHYDFRLEINGTLKSWAVPKGVPFAKGEKRLAVHVEDHPVSYIHFEGTIPKGQYGGGTVMVWDLGTFSTTSPSPGKDLESGKLHFTLAGKKLHGDWHLVQLRGSEQWLLIKSSENLKPLSQKADDTSALSGRSITQISRGSEVWQSKPRHPENTPLKKRLRQKTAEQARTSRKNNSSLKFVEPMKAQLAVAPPKGDWLYEIKFDGFRALALKSGDKVELVSRNNKDFSEKFPDIFDAIKSLKMEDAILDGEIVALDSKGISSFQLLQAFELGETRPAIYYYVFDLLRLNGTDLRQEPLADRKRLLGNLLAKAPDEIRYSASLGDDAEKLLKQARKIGLEGLIGKRKDSAYESGRRSSAWIKLKLHREQEFVIGGYTDPQGSRPHFGALLIGFYKNNKLQFCGKVGTGFNTRLLENLNSQFQAVAQKKCPFANLPEPRGGRYGAGLTVAEMRRCHWVKPKMVAQIKFAEWTRDEKLRQPVFLGLREDKTATEVIREKAK